MAHDVGLAERIRAILADGSIADGVDLSERKMFGGLSFFVDGKMAVAASSRGSLMVRVDPATIDELIETTVAEPMDMGARTMRGWVQVPVDAVDTEPVLTTWVRQGVAYAKSLTAD